MAMLRESDSMGFPQSSHAVSSPAIVSSAAPAILGEITASLAAGQQLRDLLDRFLEPIVRLAGAESGAVRMLSADGDHLELVSTIGVPPAVVEAERVVERSCGFCGQGAAGQRIVRATELSGCAARTHGAFFGHECRSALAVPLQHKNRVLGIYNLFYAQGHAPSPAVLGLLRSIGELLGLALENVRLEAENLQASPRANGRRWRRKSTTRLRRT
jgi:two-component system nitrate/nitrite sensor histidine kinase NarX